MTDNEITHEIIAAAIEVHKLLGPRLLESGYEECPCHEFALPKINFERQKPVPLVYKEKKRGCGLGLDLPVERRIAAELKAVEALGPIHEATMLTYLSLSGHKLGLLITCNDSILKEGIRRFMM